MPSGLLRVVTHPRVFGPPSRLEDVGMFAGQAHNRPNAVVFRPRHHHRAIFTQLCKAAGAKGNLLPDALLAALAIESGNEWATTDRDYAHFPGLS